MEINFSEIKNEFFFYSIKVPIYKISILDLFMANEKIVDFYFKSKDHRYEYLAFGKVLQLKDIVEVQKIISFHKNIVFYGGFCFEFFMKSCIFLPQMEVVRRNNIYFLRYNFISSFIGKFFNLVFFYDLCRKSNNKLLFFIEKVSFLTWIKYMKKAFFLFNCFFQKTVLARKKKFFFKKKIKLIFLMKKIIIQNSYFFYYKNINFIFLGNSPERLFIRNKNIIKTEALAGTQKRGRTYLIDLKYEILLLSSIKEKNEHNFVLNDIKKILNKVCINYKQIIQREIVKFLHVQHLISILEGILLKNVRDLDIIKGIHPTSAVCGFCKTRSMLFTGKNETFRRNFYSGALGFLSKNKSELSVGIRSIRFINNILEIYGGAGIVENSIYKNEWNEIEAKMKFFIDIFQL